MKKLYLILLSSTSLGAFTNYIESLGYDYSALEPHISTDIMKLHYDKHYHGYAQKLHKAVENTKDLVCKTPEYLLAHLELVPASIKQIVIDNAGGVANHSLFWKSMHPKGKRKPTGKLLKALKKTFGSYQKFKDQFTQKAQSVFGSGWVWLCKDTKNNLNIVTTSNQDSPLSKGLTPLLNLDLWEHAYYLQYYNKRNDYINAWWHIVDWLHAEELFDKK